MPIDKVDCFNSRREWDDFLTENKGDFLQSVRWGDFKSKYQRVERIAAKDKGAIKGVCQFFEEITPFGKYFYIPRGPISNDKQIREDLFCEVAKIGNREGKMFAKTEPAMSVDIGKMSFREIQPRKTLVVDISDPVEIFKGFTKSTRRSIKEAEKRGVVIKKDNDVKDFFRLMKNTQERQGFNTYPERYFHEMLKGLNCDLLYAEQEGKRIAALIVLYFGNMATIMHSAFDHEYRKTRAPSLLRFEAMRIAHEKGYTQCDFRGIDETRFPGVTKFKKGFGGKEICYPQGKDIPLKKVPYFLYYLGVITRRCFK